MKNHQHLYASCTAFHYTVQRNIFGSRPGNPCMGERIRNINRAKKYIPNKIKEAKIEFYRFCSSRWGFRTALISGTLIKTIGLARAAGSGGGQNFCSTGAGQMLGGIQHLSTLALGSLITIFLIAIVILKMIPLRGTDRAANVAIGGFLLGLIVLVFGGSMIHYTNQFTDISLTQSC